MRKDKVFAALKSGFLIFYSNSKDNKHRKNDHKMTIK